MSRTKRSGLWVASSVLGWLVLPAVAWAQADARPGVEAKPAAQQKAVPNSKATAEQIAAWVAQLTSRDFRVRRTASQRLIAAGSSAIGQVARAADGNDLERTTRCLAVLKQLQSSKDAKTKAVAGAALKKLAASRNATVARRAQAALPKVDPSPSVGGIRRGIVIRGRAVNGNRVSVRVTNGQRTIEAKEGTRKVLINDSNGKDIRMTITDKPNGKVVSREVKAANAEALKKADPEAYKLYQQYTKNNALQIKILPFGVGGPGGLRRAFPLKPLRPVLPLPRFSQWHQQVEAARTQVDAAVSRLQKLAAKPQVKPEELREVLEQLAAARKTLSVMLATPANKLAPPKKEGAGKPGPDEPARRPRPSEKTRPKVIKTRGV